MEYINIGIWILAFLWGFTTCEIMRINRKLNDLGYVHINFGSGEDE